MEKRSLRKRISYGIYRVIRWMVQVFYPKISVEGVENLPEEPCLLVGNHSKMNGPIIGELYIPGKRAIWCAGEMMEWNAVADYAFRDFWSEKTRYIRWFFRIVSYLITPLSVCVFSNARTIPVYRDGRILTTFRKTVEHLADGANVVVFPEHAEPYNHIVNQFQEGFVDIGRLYYKKTGKELPFVPVYIAPNLKKVYLGEPIRFCSAASKAQERTRICQSLMAAITEMAVSLPEHAVIPYNNIPKRDYPTNIPQEVPETIEKTCC